jgi:hypothetical protein
MKIKELDMSKSWVTWAYIGFGIQVWVCFHPSSPCPLGFVWGTAYGGSKKRFDVFGSYTETYYRRLGVRKRINEELLKTYSLITSASASTAGKKFMQSQGYKYSAHLCQWYKER